METNKLIEKYTYRVEWSEEDKLHIGRCLEFPSLAAHGGMVSTLLVFSCIFIYAILYFLS
jgi:hypothetical protein